MDNKIIRAIQLIKADAQVSVTKEDIDTIVWENGETPIAKTDIEAKISEAETLIANEAQAKIDNKVNGNSKLLGLGLTQAEATALTGYAPPAEV
tara:strand:+ start:318 stop:599 length:282 start_codon:yes stop_codon:yes gene_type:complete